MALLGSPETVERCGAVRGATIDTVKTDLAGRPSVAISVRGSTGRQRSRLPVNLRDLWGIHCEHFRSLVRQG